MLYECMTEKGLIFMKQFFFHNQLDPTEMNQYPGGCNEIYYYFESCIINFSLFNQKNNTETGSQV